MARKQGQPSRSKLDPHERFILGLIAQRPDSTLAEIAGQLAVEHGVRVVPSRGWVERDILNWSRISSRSSGAITRRNAAAYFAREAT